MASVSGHLYEGEEEYEVESILRHKGEGASRLYQVLWKGYPITKASWEPESNLRNAPDILEDYLHRVAEAENRRPWTREAGDVVDGVPEDLLEPSQSSRDGYSWCSDVK